MIRKTVKTMLFFYEIAWNYGYLFCKYNTKTLTKNDLLNHATKQYKINNLNHLPNAYFKKYYIKK